MKIGSSHMQVYQEDRLDRSRIVPIVEEKKYIDEDK
jgi:hypothetical protein